jgi:hypothetical protein
MSAESDTADPPGQRSESAQMFSSGRTRSTPHLANGIFEEHHRAAVLENDPTQNQE